MEKLMDKAIEAIELEMEAMGKIDDSDYADRFLDKLAESLANEDFDYQELLEGIKEYMDNNYESYGECNEVGVFKGGYKMKGGNK